MKDLGADQSVTPFEKTLNIVKGRMLSALSAFYIWKWFHHAININQEGGPTAAEKQLEIINRHKAVFQQIIVSTYKSFVADLAIFFDGDSFEQTFSLKKLLKTTADKIPDIEIEAMKQEIEKIKREHKMAISFILELRNSDVAHQEMDSKPRKVIYAEIEALFVAVQQILDLISHKHSSSITMWSHVEKEIQRQMSWIFSNLERGESDRRKEVEAKYKGESSQDKI